MKFTSLLLAGTALVVAARTHDGGTPIAEALGQLDPSNDAHWTTDGLPRIDTVKSLTGDSTVNRAAIESAKPGFNRTSAASPEPSASSESELSPAMQADGWQPHPTAVGYSYKGQEVVATAELTARYAQASGTDQSATAASTTAQDISAQTGVGGTTTARSPAPVEGELRKTHVSEPSNGEPGEKPIGVVQGVTGAGENLLGTPEGTVQNAGRAIELSGEIAARNAGSVLTPSQAPAQGSNTPSISLGGAADPLVEGRAPGGAVVMEGADPATFFEGETVGGPFGSSGITASDGSSQAQLAQMGRDFDGNPEEVEALTAELEQAEARTSELRGQIDDLTGEMHASIREEARLRRLIEANRPQSGTTATIQNFLRSQQERRAAAVQNAK